MMNKKIFLMCMLLSNLVFSQVGINTPTPNASLDILSKGIDGTTKALKINNSAATSKEMVTVLDNNNFGIGVSNPLYNLEIGDFLNNGSYLSLSQTGSNANGQSSLTYFTKRDNSNSITNATSKGWKWFALSDAYAANPALANSLFLEGWNNGVRTQNILVANPNGNVGFGIQNPTARVHINVSAPGTGFRLVDGSQGAGKTLVSDANGNASWQANSSTFVGFSAYYNGSDTAIAANQPFHFDTTEYITSGSFSNNTWTVGESGFYYIVSRVWVNVNAGQAENIAIYINGTLYRFGTRDNDSPSVNSIVHLNAGDKISANAQFGNVSGTIEHSGSANTYLSAYKVGN